MGPLKTSKATLRIVGDALDPLQITQALGRSPHLSHRKGETKRNGSPAVTGQWHLEASPASPGDLDAQVAEILGSLSQDLSVWRELRRLYRMDLFCGLFMEGSNQGLEISADTMRALAERGIDLGLDMYSTDGASDA
jgi:Domain of unknown function (DUF4279)